jgi:hypothetical protein
VNFFGHACLAADTRPDAAFVFGAMLPDLAGMAGLRISEVAHADADAGRRFHYATDAAFHRAAGFSSLCSDATRALTAAGLRRGPARAIGHVGVELLLDGWLASERGVPALYGEALALGPALAPSIVFRVGRGVAPLLELCGRIAPAPLLELCERIAAAPHPPEDWCAPERLTSRLARILGRRPLLALLAGELPAVCGWAARARPDVAAAAPALLEEVRGSLATVAPSREAP